MPLRSKVFGIMVLCTFCAVSLTVAQEQQQGNMGDLMKALGAAMSGGGTTATVTVVDFREIKALLPPALDGMKRTNAGGEKSSAMGMTMSFADATYTAEGGGSIVIKITDNGGIGGLMAIAAAGWENQEIDRETETGFERTASYGQYKAKEEYDNSSKSGKVELMIAKRFMVEVNGSDVSMEAIQAAVKKIDLDKLATLKPKAVQM